MAMNFDLCTPKSNQTIFFSPGEYYFDFEMPDQTDVVRLLSLTFDKQNHANVCTTFEELP